MKPGITVGMLLLSILLLLSFSVALAEKIDKINATEKSTINVTDNLTTPNASENITMPTNRTMSKNMTNETRNSIISYNKVKSLGTPSNRAPLKIGVATIAAVMNETK